MNITDIWMELEKEAAKTPRHGLLRRRAFADSEANVFLAVKKPGGDRLLLVSVEAAVANVIKNFPKAKGCGISNVKVSEDPPDKIAICLALTDDRFADIFQTLLADVIECLRPLCGDREIVDALVARVERWQAFLDRFGHEGLSDAAQRGLFGELWFLHAHLLHVMTARTALRAWKGPSRKVHDFQFPYFSVEVKTTASKEHTKLTIASERQLDDTNLKYLLLFHVSLDAHEAGGMALPDLIEQLRKEVESSAARDLLEDLLFRCGYLDSQSHLYRSPSYSIRSEHSFRVTNGFPRLIMSDVPQGVGDVCYTIMLKDCMPFRISERQLQEVLAEASNAAGV